MLSDRELEPEPSVSENKTQATVRGATPLKQVIWIPQNPEGYLTLRSNCGC
jgi:hypothetical protein